MTMLVLSVVQGPFRQVNETRQISSGEFVMGRSVASDWVLDDPECIVSGRHCVFRQDDAGWSVTDCSRNGTHIANDAGHARVGSQSRRLVVGDRLQIGRYELSVDLEEDEASFRIVPLAQIVGRIGTAQPIRSLRSVNMPRIAPHLAFRSTQLHAVGDQDDTMQLALPAGLRAGVRRPPVARAAPSIGIVLITLVRNLRRSPSLQDRLSLPRQGGPLLDAPSERDAAGLLASGGEAAGAAVEVAFAELRLHQACLLQAGRACARELFESLDPDEPDRRMMPSWKDLLPGWRRARAFSVSRRSYRRMAVQLEQILDRGFERAYARAWRDARDRWDTH